MLSFCALLLCSGCALINTNTAPTAADAPPADHSAELSARQSSASATNGDQAATEHAAQPTSSASQATSEPLAQSPVQHQTKRKADPQPAATAAAQSPGQLLDRLLAGFSFPDCSQDSQALIWQSWYLRHPDYLQRVFRRATPWLYLVMAQVEAHDLPLEFALLPVIESAYDVFALSPAGAHGAWQITLPTAQDYGLSVRPGFDARRDMVLATKAATRMLQRLLTDFDGNWRLALAAYNAGPTRVARAARRARGELRELDPARLALPRETKTFAPKLHGLVCLLREHRDRLPLPDMLDQPIITSVEFDHPVDLVAIAQQAEIDIAALYTLNAGLSNHLTPANGYAVKLPLRHWPAYQAALAAADAKRELARQKLASAAPAQPAPRVTVRRGDTLGDIARRHNTTVQTLQQVNQLSGNLIRPGQVLQLKASAAPQASSSKAPGYTAQLTQLQQMQRSLPGVNSLRHRIGRNETLSTIARRYRISVAQLQSWNNISNPHRIRAGQTLQIFHPQPTAASSSGYRVQRGDSLWTIARRFRISLQDLMDWNQLSGSSVLRPGQLLRLAP